MSWTDGADGFVLLDTDSTEDGVSAMYGYDPEDTSVQYMVMTPVAATARR